MAELARTVTDVFCGKAPRADTKLKHAVIAERLTMKRIVVAVLILFISSVSWAIDFEDCQDRLNKLRKSANSANTVASSGGADFAEEIGSSLSDVESALARAKRACGQNDTYCATISRLSRSNGKQAAETVCKATEVGDQLRICLACAGVR